MKRISSILCALVLTLMLCACSKQDAGDIQVNFINRTGASILQVAANELSIGAIAANAETGYRRFREFGTDTGMPDVSFNGVWKQKPLKSTAQFYWCGTEKSKLQPGQYTVEVHILERGTEAYFHLRFQ